MKKIILTATAIVCAMLFSCASHTNIRPQDHQNAASPALQVINPLGTSDSIEKTNRLPNPAVTSLLKCPFYDGSGRMVVADTNMALLMGQASNGGNLWIIDLKVNYPQFAHKITSLQGVSNKNCVVVSAGPGGNDYYFEQTTGKFLGASFNHQSN